MTKKEDKVKELEAQIETLTSEKEECLNSWKRECANHINYKNKEIERTQELVVNLKEMMLEGLVPILENMILANRSIREEDKNNPTIKGLLMIEKQLEDVLKEMGIEEISEKDIDFNPEIHEVLEEVESSDNSGKVTEIIQKGYKINGKVFKPAKVKIIK